MKKQICILTAVIAVLGMSPHPASAGLLGTPLNLKSAIEQRDTQKPVWQFYPDGIFADPASVWEC
jgi:hypothetical protein